MFDISVQVTIILFLLGLAFYSGTIAQRVSVIEEWRKELRLDLRDMRDEFRQGLSEVKVILELQNRSHRHTDVEKGTP